LKKVQAANIGRIWVGWRVSAAAPYTRHRFLYLVTMNPQHTELNLQQEIDYVPGMMELYGSDEENCGYNDD
jgi:hypothetical protein